MISMSFSKNFYEIKNQLHDMKRQLNLIEGRLDRIESMSVSRMTIDLISLPDNLRKTYMILLSAKEATATVVSEQTERARAVESSYLNQLVRLGFLKKQKKGRETVFRLFHIVGRGKNSEMSSMQRL